MTYTYGSAPDGVGLLGLTSAVVNGADTSIGIDSIIDKYDAVGRILFTTRNIEGVPYTTQRSFDWASRTINLVYPDNDFITYEYHAGPDLIHYVKCSWRTLSGVSRVHVRWSSGHGVGKVLLNVKTWLR